MHNTLNADAMPEIHRLFENIHHQAHNGSDLKPIVPGLSQYGAVLYQNYYPNNIPENLKNEINVGINILSKLTSVISAAVMAKNNDHSLANYDFSIWKNIISVLIPAFFSDPLSGDKSINTTVKGKHIIDTFLDATNNSNLADNSQLHLFLQSLGQSLSQEITTDIATYNILASCSIHNLVQAPSGELTYQPQLKVYYIPFQPTQKEILTSCQAIHKINLDFSIPVIGATFAISKYINNESFKTKVNNFLNKFEAQSIEAESTYFSGAF